MKYALNHCMQIATFNAKTTKISILISISLERIEYAKRYDIAVVLLVHRIQLFIFAI